MFHRLAQTAELLITPTNALVIAILFGAAAALAWRRAAWARRLAILAAVLLSLLSLPGVGDAMLRPLETRFSPYAPDGGAVAGIIVLGGTVDTAHTSRWGTHSEPNGAVDRIFEAARLATLYPAASVVVSGGPIETWKGLSEADDVAAYLRRLGVAGGRIIEERASVDTFENARFSAARLGPRPGQRWLLVTSAVHMPRAMACFRAAGFRLTAAPADWRLGATTWPVGWSASGDLAKVDGAFKEYLGLIVYRLSGRTREWFPGP